MLPGDTKNAIRRTRGTNPLPTPTGSWPNNTQQSRPASRQTLPLWKALQVFSSFTAASRKHLWDLATLPGTRTPGPHSENQNPLAFLLPLPPGKPQCRHWGSKFSKAWWCPSETLLMLHRLPSATYKAVTFQPGLVWGH